MTLGSICDGIGGWQLAAVRAGIKPIWSSEIDKFCLSVTARHFPKTIQLGDVTKITDAPKVDIITAGTPCQSLSVAGRREGLKGESGLFFSAIKLVRRVNPRFFIWENVPGALSSSGRNDFRIVLEEILEEPIPLPQHWSKAGMVDGRKCQVAWRQLDAQHFGVPQRRKRIFLVADFRGRRAGEILFECEGVRRDFEASESTQSNLTARTGRNADSAIGTVYSVQGNIIGRQLKNGANGKGINENISFTLNTVDRHAVAYGIGRDAFNQGRNAQYKPTIERELQPALTARGAAAVAYDVVRRLTPLECERLQGLPDGWTAGGSDAKRYKALGNGMAQPCADWILRRIVERS